MKTIVGVALAAAMACELGGVQRAEASYIVYGYGAADLNINITESGTAKDENGNQVPYSINASFDTGNYSATLNINNLYNVNGNPYTYPSGLYYNGKTAFIGINYFFYGQIQSSVFALLVFSERLIVPLSELYVGNTISISDLLPDDKVNNVLEIGLSNYKLYPSSQSVSGSFDIVQTISVVPLPASAPMFGAALLALAGIGYARRRGSAKAA